ncbi:colicin E3/pyocin S6 family cytotoxin [Magnetospira sp. QH-2]|uniref:colicin E3/pyocin S6 family cytotoxin n=1 Tax=Magnetospira sp. (strain QH-2) TaxID=1288970 RepID=UPI000697DC41|nr:colicin E3/pyocin S6 family cytotoxin [Magnetospira sp. QH-2]
MPIPLAKSDATPTLGADPTDRQTRAFNKRQEAANLKAARADSDAAWKFHQDKKAAEQKAASQRIQARRQAQAAERQQEAQARQVRWTQPNLRPSLANQPKGPKPVGSEEDYKRDFQRHPVTAQAEADRIVDTIPVEDWSSTQALMAQTSPGYFQSGHPANNKVRPKVDRWYKNTYPGKIDLSSGQSARGGGGMQADDRRQVDAHINAGSGTRAKAVAAYDPDVLLPSAGDSTRAPDLTKRLETLGRDRDWTPGEIEDFKDQFDALDGREQESYLRMLEGDAGPVQEGNNDPQTREDRSHMDPFTPRKKPHRQGDDPARLAMLVQSPETGNRAQSSLPPGYSMDEQGRIYDPQGRRVPNPHKDPNIHNAGGVVPVPGPLPLPVPPEMVPGHKERTEQLNTLGQWANEKLQQAFPKGLRYKAIPIVPPSKNGSAAPRTDMAAPQKPMPPSPAPAPEPPLAEGYPADPPGRDDGMIVDEIPEAMDSQTPGRPIHETQPEDTYVTMNRPEDTGFFNGQKGRQRQEALNNYLNSDRAKQDRKRLQEVQTDQASGHVPPFGKAWEMMDRHPKTTIRSRPARTNGLTGKKKRYYVWDSQHGEIEVHDARGRHLGAVDPITLKPKPDKLRDKRKDLRHGEIAKADRPDQPTYG